MLLLHCSDKGLSATYTVGSSKKNIQLCPSCIKAKEKFFFKKLDVVGWWFTANFFMHMPTISIGKVFQRPNNKMQMEKGLKQHWQEGFCIDL